MRILTNWPKEPRIPNKYPVNYTYLSWGSVLEMNKKKNWSFQGYTIKIITECLLEVR